MFNLLGKLKVKKTESVTLTHEEITDLAQEMVSILISEVMAPEESEEIVENIVSLLVSKAEEIIEGTPMPQHAFKTGAVDMVRSILSSLILKTMEEATATKPKQGNY